MSGDDVEMRPLVDSHVGGDGKQAKTSPGIGMPPIRFRGPLRSPLARVFVRNGFLILTWYVLGTTLTLYNKTLLGKKHGMFGNGAFPAPMFMSAVQFFLQACLAKLVFRSGIVQRSQATPLTWPAYLRVVVPNGVTTGLDIALSNQSLVFITMSFYTMCKSTTPVFLLFFAFIWRIERPCWSLAGVVCVIVSGLLLLVEGESEFDTTGFALVMSASCLSGLRFVLTQVLLQGQHSTAGAPIGAGERSSGGDHGHGGSFTSPLEVLESLTPVMAATVGILSLAWEQVWHTLPGSPYFTTLYHASATFLVILAGACIAFLMVWAEYKVIKETSALTFMIAGIVKEVVVVIAAVVLMGDHFGPENVVGLCIVILGVVLFNVYKYRKIRAGELSPKSVSPKSEKKKADEGIALQALSNGAAGAKGDAELAPLLPVQRKGSNPL